MQREYGEIGLVLEELSNTTLTCFRIRRPRAEATTFCIPKKHFIPGCFTGLGKIIVQVEVFGTVHLLLGYE
jgi:hypothetical protein